MMRNVHLHGRLKKIFGGSFRFDVESAAEALRALNCAFPAKFVDELKRGHYQIIRGRRHGGLNLDIEEVLHLRLGMADLHIVPVTAGSKNARQGGTFKMIAGAVLIGGAILLSGGTLAAPLAGMAGGVLPGLLGGAVTWGNIAMIGVGLVFAGAAQMKTKPPETKSTESAAAENSHMMNGPTNINEQGSPVPCIYGGPILVGAQAVSAGFDIEQIGAYTG
jgi:predicted phage tail protein